MTDDDADKFGWDEGDVVITPPPAHPAPKDE